MNTEDAVRIVLIGVGATAVLDAWLMLLKRLGVKTLAVALIGRWIGHSLRGDFVHPAIAQAAPVRGEGALGWIAHYAIGIAFAALLYTVRGTLWLHSPSLLPAVTVGVCTAVAPLFVMQPAMGAGFVASKTATPMKNCFRSVINHAVFGAGLYVSAAVLIKLW